MKLPLVPFFMLCCLSIIGCRPNNYEVSSENIPEATGVQISTWNSATNLSLGIRAYDPVNNRPTEQSHDSWDLFAPTKQNLAGRFNRFGSYDEKIIGKLYDWNIMIHCFDEYTGLYNSVKQQYYDPSEWHGCITPGNPCGTPYNNNPCMWAEIAPDPAFSKNNDWFPVSEDDHCVEGYYLAKNDTVGVYGCYVTDDEHGNQPEIHPAQQIWFRNKSISADNNDHYWLMFLQDASDRYGNWSASPIYGQFHIAFKVKPKLRPNAAVTPQTMNLSIASQLDLVTNAFADHNYDCDNGYSHALVVDGQKLLVVNEPESTDDENKIGVQFVDLAKLPDGSIQGYVQVSLVLGDYDTDPIGVCVLGLEVIPAKSELFVEDVPVKDQR